MTEANIAMETETRRYVSVAKWDENLTAVAMVSVIRSVLIEHPETDTILLTRAEIERLLEYVDGLQRLASGLSK